MPTMPCVGVPSNVPAHAPTITSRVAPTAQVSAKPRAVPVFAAIRNGRSNGSSMPKPGRRASGSASMSITSHAVSGENTRRSGACGGDQRRAVGHHGAR